MKYQTGFTLFELMIAIAVIAILSAIAFPAYQGYMQKAALTDALLTSSAYRTATELCYLDEGQLQNCNSGQSGIPASKASRYISTINVEHGKITLSGQSALQGLTITLTAVVDNVSGQLIWQRNCRSVTGQQNLIDACKNVFRFDDEA